MHELGGDTFICAGSEPPPTAWLLCTISETDLCEKRVIGPRSLTAYHFAFQTCDLPNNLLRLARVSLLLYNVYKR
jgi:hypothetical protein